LKREKPLGKQSTPFESLAERKDEEWKGMKEEAEYGHDGV
jgi:hypothetical protein